MKKLGESEWLRLSEKERQNRIVQIKKKEINLRLQGRYDEIHKMFEFLQINETGLFRK